MCEHCAGGCATRTDHRRGKVMRRLAAEDPEVNEEWICDKGRFGFRYAQRPDRLTTPLVRGGRRARPGELARGAGSRGPWTRAPRADGRRTDRRPATVEDAYAYAKFARVALGTNDIDFRARVHSAEEADFLAAQSPARRTSTAAVSPTPRWRRPRRCSSPASSPRRRHPASSCDCARPHRKHEQRTFALAPFATPGLEKLAAPCWRPPPAPSPNG